MKIRNKTIIITSMQTLNKQLFDSMLNENFEITFNQEETTLCTLIEVKELNTANQNSETVQAYSLLFSSSDATVCNQGSYLIRSDKLNETYIFLVPVSANEQGVKYEAVFN
jgi:hypothetical protein